jgi:hypothetical protein
MWATKSDHVRRPSRPGPSGVQARGQPPRHRGSTPVGHQAAPVVQSAWESSRAVPAHPPESCPSARSRACLPGPCLPAGPTRPGRACLPGPCLPARAVPTRPSRARPSRARPSRARPSRARPNRVHTSEPNLCSSARAGAGPGLTHPSRIGPGPHPSEPNRGWGRSRPSRAHRLDRVPFASGPRALCVRAGPTCLGFGLCMTPAAYDFAVPVHDLNHGTNQAPHKVPRKRGNPCERAIRTDTPRTRPRPSGSHRTGTAADFSSNVHEFGTRGESLWRGGQRSFRWLATPVSPNRRAASRGFVRSGEIWPTGSTGRLTRRLDACGRCPRIPGRTVP